MRFRTLAGAGIIIGIALLVLLDGLLPSRPIVPIFMLLLAALGWIEFSRISGLSGSGMEGREGSRLLHAIGLAAVVYYFALAWVSSERALPGGVDAWTLGGLSVTVLLASILAVLRVDFERSYRLLLDTVLGSVLIGLLPSYYLKIYKLPGWTGLVYWSLLVVGVKGNDTAAYYSGKTWGRHRFLPVSPKKTLEGSIGAILFSTLYFGVACAMVRLAEPESLFPWYGGMLFGVIISMTSQAGDLVESLFKRAHGVKDSGSILPEFGGALDMIDSLFFAGIIFWWIV
jgi:phosphatidate cytidylyltransferase